MSAAVDAFGLGPLEVTPEEMDELGFAMIDAISTAFGMRVSLRAPWEAAPQAPGGFGSWLSILACLIAQIGMSRIDALACPVAQAFALIATHRFNQGWQVVGDTYAQRDALVEVSREEEHSGRMPEWAGKMPAVPTTETEEEAN